MRSSSRAEAALGALPAAFAVAAEGAWITVVYAAVQVAIGGTAPLLGLGELTVVVALGLGAVRLRLLEPDAQPLRFLALALLAGIIGWLWSGDARDALGRLEVVEAFGHHPAGWIALLGFMRGVGLGGGIDDRSSTRLVLLGLPALALPWGLGHLAAPGLVPSFVEDAFAASLTFVAAGFMAAGLARLQVIGAETGLDWRRDRSWLALVGAAVALVVAVGVPGAALLGLPIEVVARGAIGPLAALAAYLFLGMAYLVGFLYVVLATVLAGIGLRIELPPPRAVSIFGEIREYTFEELQGGLLAVGVFWAVVAVLALIVARTWLRRRGRAGGRADDEERAIVVPAPSIGLALPTLRWPALRRRHGPPSDAVGAYLAALEDLEASSSNARRPAETPRGHARRVSGELGGTELALLQADYALDRYAARALSRAEHTRAVARWLSLRRRLRGR